MRALSLKIPAGPRARYLRIAEGVRSAIKGGQLLPGEELPSTRALAGSLRVHRHTIMKALEELIAEGWIVASQRKNYRVSETLPSEYLRSGRPGGARRSERASFAWRLARTPDELPELVNPEVRYSFQAGIPDLRLFPFKELRSHWADAMRRSGPRLMGYGQPYGHPRFLRALEVYLRRVRGIAGRTLVVTHGSQEAIFLSAQLLLAPGDRVAVEALGYPPAWHAFRSAGAELAPVSIDSRGMDPEALESLLESRAGKRVRLIYLTPLHQFPSTVTLPVDRRMRILELSLKHGVPILEDDYDHEFHYRSQPLCPLVSQDGAESVIYVSTFSKVLYPSARLGFVALPETLARRFGQYRKITTRQTDSLIQDAVARWMEEGGLERHLRRMRRAYEERRDVICECLDSLRKELPRMSFDPPDGGMAVWTDTGTDSLALYLEARRAGILVQPEAAFRSDGRAGTHLRLGFANQSPAELRRAIASLGEVIAGRPVSRGP